MANCPWTCWKVGCKHFADFGTNVAPLQLCLHATRRRFCNPSCNKKQTLPFCQLFNQPANKLHGRGGQKCAFWQQKTPCKVVCTKVVCKVLAWKRNKLLAQTLCHLWKVVQICKTAYPWWQKALLWWSKIAKQSCLDARILVCFVAQCNKFPTCQFWIATICAFQVCKVACVCLDCKRWGTWCKKRTKQCTFARLTPPNFAKRRACSSTCSTYNKRGMQFAFPNFYLFA